MTDIIEKTPSPLMGEGWGGGEKPQLIELLLKNLHWFEFAAQFFILDTITSLPIIHELFKHQSGYFHQGPAW